MWASTTLTSPEPGPNRSTGNILMARPPGLPGPLDRSGGGLAELAISATSYGQNVMANIPVPIALVRPDLSCPRCTDTF
jgi:hypothetical protein